MEDGNEFNYSYIMCLNVITDLCRLLSRGYYHLYHVFSIIHSSTLSSHLEDLSILTTEEFIPFTLFEQLSQQYHLFISQSSLANEHSNAFYYMRYLQALQKMVYLVIIDDYLSSTSSTSFEQWMKNRPEISNILFSLNSATTKVFASTNINDTSVVPWVDSPIVGEDMESTQEKMDKTKEIITARNSLENETPFIYRHINGLVLNLNSIIKDDYFPGSRNIHLVTVTVLLL